MSLLELRGVTRDYQLGKTWVHALRGVDLFIHAGEILSIIGPSGSGKSTMLHMIGSQLKKQRAKESHGIRFVTVYGLQLPVHG